jgi:hypothetical protein
MASQLACFEVVLRYKSNAWPAYGTTMHKPPAALGATSTAADCALPCCLLQAFLLRKLKISGSMGMAMKLPAVLEAAQPKSKM